MIVFAFIVNIVPCNEVGNKRNAFEILEDKYS